MAAEDKQRPTESAKRTPPDHRLIEIDKPGEVTFWMKWFGVSEDELREAVRVVGNSAHNVSTYFSTFKRSS